MRKQGRQQSEEGPKRDKLDLHETVSVDDELEEELFPLVELCPEHGLDLTA